MLFFLAKGERESDVPSVLRNEDIRLNPDSRTRQAGFALVPFPPCFLLLIWKDYLDIEKDSFDPHHACKSHKTARGEFCYLRVAPPHSPHVFIILVGGVEEEEEGESRVIVR